MKRYISEFIGTLVLVFLGCGTAVLTGCEAYGGYIATALAFGLSIVAMAYAIGNISGCHVNPAVSIAVYLNGNLSGKDTCGYIASQIIGAFAGAGLLAVIFGRISGLGANAIYQNSGISFLIEFLLSFIFIFVVLRAASTDSKLSGLIIGLTLTLVHLLGIGLTGTSVNPARSLAPAILSGNTEGLWVFLLAPVAGGILAALCHKYLEK